MESFVTYSYVRLVFSHMQTARGGRVVVLLLLILASANCSSRDADSSIYAEIPTAVAQPGLNAQTASGVSPAAVLDAPADEPSAEAMLASFDSVPQELFDEVERFYGRYLSQRASVVDATIELDGLDGLVTESGRAQAAERRAYNDGLHAEERFSAVDSLWLFANIARVSQIDSETILVRDCTERHEVNALDQFWVFWETNQVTIDVSTGEMLVADHQTLHNGWLEAEKPIGCAPISFQERAEATSALVWNELLAWSESSDGRNADALTPMIGEPLRTRIVEAAEDTGDLQFGETVEDAFFRAVGLDTTAAVGSTDGKAIVAVVDSCHRFPNGRIGRNVVTGETVQDVGPGDEQALRFRVLIDPGSAEDRLDQVIAIDFRPEGCER